MPESGYEVFKGMTTTPCAPVCLSVYGDQIRRSESGNGLVGELEVGTGVGVHAAEIVFDVVEESLELLFVGAENWPQ